MKVTAGDIHIEPLKPSHWSKILRIQVYPLQQAFVPAPMKVQSQYIFERKEEKPPFDIFVIEWGNKLVGFFTLVKDVDDYLWFGGFQVDIAFQSTGIGRAVFERLYAFVSKSAEFAGISLNVQQNNKAVIRFYQRLGFSLVAMMESEHEPLWLMKISRETIEQRRAYNS